jgi:hypothetical protein
MVTLNLVAFSFGINTQKVFSRGLNFSHVARSISYFGMQIWQTKCNVVRCPKLRRKEVTTFVIVGMRRIWLERNTSTFDLQSSTLHQTVNKTVQDMEDWAMARQQAGSREDLVVLCEC